MVYYIRGIIYNVYSKFPVGSSAINQNSKKARAWPVQLLVFIADLDEYKQTRACDSLYNYFNDTVYISVMFVSALQPNTTFNLSKHWASIRGVLIYWRKKPVYDIIIHGKAVQCESQKNILQYYKFVIQILDSVYGLIYTACVHKTTRLSPKSELVYVTEYRLFLVFKIQ